MEVVEHGDSLDTTLPFSSSLLNLDQVSGDNFTLKSELDLLLEISEVGNATDNGKGGNFGEFLAQTGLSAKSAVINVRVLVFLVLNLKKEWSSFGFLMLHHIALILISNFYDVIRAAMQCQLISVKESGKLCGIWIFFEDLLYAMIQLDAILIVFERVQAAKTEWKIREEKSGSDFFPETKDLKVYRITIFLWILAIVGSWPWTYTFGYLERFVTGICLKPIRNRKKRFREHILRFAYLSSVFSLVLMLPAGILRGTFKILSSGVFGKFEMGASSYLIWIDRMATLLNYIYYMIYPLIYTCVHEDMKVRKVLGYGWIKPLLVRFLLKLLDGKTEAEVELKKDSETEEVVPQPVPPATRPTTLAVVEDMEFFDIGGNPIHRRRDAVAKGSKIFWTVPVIVETLVKDVSCTDLGTQV
ncbi:unnamed protein product [Orchesella dallaii]|uniref:Uncharacterized protein n=1 Tax=Orchesella dallaii TaxID=48710 RepID=A0ABP1S7J5_9HEXA